MCLFCELIERFVRGEVLDFEYHLNIIEEILELMAFDVPKNVSLTVNEWINEEYDWNQQHLNSHLFQCKNDSEDPELLSSFSLTQDEYESDDISSSWFSD